MSIYFRVPEAHVAGRDGRLDGVGRGVVKTYEAAAIRERVLGQIAARQATETNVVLEMPAAEVPAQPVEQAEVA